MSCPLCRTDDSTVAHVGEFVLRGEGLVQETRVCNGCGMTFEVAEPEQDWSSLYGDVWHRGALPNAMQRALYQNDAELIGPPPCTSAGRAFDIGCGAGLLLDELKAVGWQTAGCDPETGAIEEARAKGHEVYPELFRPLDEYQADLVILGDVLEHVPDPLALLEQVRRVVRPGGRFYVRVPDLEKVNYETFGDIFSLQHRVWFTADTLAEMLGLAGFAVRFTGTFARGMHAMTSSCEPRPWSRPAGEPERSLEIIRTYSRDMRARRTRIAARVERLAGRVVALYGGGEHAEELLRFSALGQIASRVVDSNDRHWGRPCGPLTVESPDHLRSEPPEAIVIASKAYQDEIAAGLADLVERGVEVVKLYAESG
ncbi:MAG: class I SAM-dependent methyltransferase [Deltaproteobacteria bacterium]|nr:class I SAM-dependent methyltransferase [Deltaproteobacteria bacterium]